jgi:hypothetical protein
MSIEWVDTGRITSSSKAVEKVKAALILRPSDLLFVHRDADNQSPELRYGEISEAAQAQPYVAVVPIRMTEAWLLIDEGALRKAAGRPSGREKLDLPPLNGLEKVADPKYLLREALRRAHGATGRRARRFNPATVMHRLADLVEDWSPLLSLSAFQRLEQDTRTALANLGQPIAGAT